MKKIFTCCLLLTFFSAIHAQFPQLWALTGSGGDSLKGDIFHIKGDGTNFNDAYDFGAVSGYSWWFDQVTLVQAGNGLLYGKSTEGGKYGFGDIFSFNPATNAYKDIYDFLGFANWGSLMLALDGKLYGMTSSGSGLHADGNIFSIDTLGNYIDLFDFTTGPDSIGREPNGGLTQASNGIIYGMTSSNAGQSDGAIFYFDPTTVSNANPPTRIHGFAKISTTTDGTFPDWNTNLLIGSDGLLYGMTALGGANSEGIVFCCDLNGNNYRIIYNFTGTPGGSPTGSLIQGANGLLYGMNNINLYNPGTGGALFSIDTNRTNANPYTTLVTFSSGTPSSGSNGTPFLASDGNIYGFTDGSNSGAGSLIFRYNISTSTYTPLYTLTTANGTNPNGNFIELRTLSTSTISGSPFCAGATVNVPFVATGIYASGNVFTAQLSDASGSFSNAVNIGTLAGTTSGIITATIPGGTPAGSGYRIRVVSGTPHLTGSDNGINITVQVCSGLQPVAGFIANDTVVCAGSTVNFTDESANSPTTWSWTFAGGTPGSSASQNPSVVYNTAGKFDVKLVAKNSQGADSITYTKYITVIARPVTGTPNALPDTVCDGNSSQLTTSGNSGNLQWQSSLTGSNFTDVAGADTTPYTTAPLSQTIQYRLIATNGSCADTSVAITVTVNANPTPPVLSISDSVICSSDSSLITVVGSYSFYFWNDGDTVSFTYAKAAGGYWVTVTGADGCTAVSQHQDISVFPVLPVSITVHGDTLSSFGAVTYQWFFNDTLVIGDTSPVYIAPNTGNYVVQVTDTNGCKALSNNQYVQITGIVEPGEPEVLNIYPNPFGNAIFIATHNSGVDQVVIYDALGRTVWSACYNNDYSNLLTIDVSALPAGSYYMTVKGTGGKNYYRQMIKL